MKSIILSLATVAATATLQSCTDRSSEVLTIAGRVTNVEDCMITVVSNTDTVSACTQMLEPCHHNTVFNDDVVMMTYTKINNTNMATELIIVNHEAPFLSNISVLLLGSWSTLNGKSNRYDLTFAPDQTVEISSPQVQSDNKQWIVDGKHLLVNDSAHGLQTVISYDILRVDTESLVLRTANNNIMRFLRKR